MSVQQDDVAARMAEMLQTDGLPGVLIANARSGTCAPMSCGT
jgi:hypothetical protein